MNNIIEEISEFVFVEHSLRSSDIIITVGGSYPQIAEKAAELYHGGFAPYVMAGGGYSVKMGHFKGVSDKADIYCGNYKTECEFYTDVLIKNGVPENAILKEDRSSHTRENATLAREITDSNNLSIKTAIVVCKRFHARRCQMFFQSAFPESEILICPADISNGDYNITKDNWYKNSYGIKRVLGELERCGNQIDENDIFNFSQQKQ
ncbi:MAG: YdcF family protein [Ruminiclostridium sp.]